MRACVTAIKDRYADCGFPGQDAGLRVAAGDFRFTQPELLDHSAELIGRARQLSPDQIASLMKISDKLAGLNAARFADWQPDFSPANARQALLAFKGMSTRGWRWRISARLISTSPRHTCACSPVSTGCCARSI